MWLAAADTSWVDTLVGVAGLAAVVVVAFGFGNSKRKSDTIKAQQELIDTYEQREEMHTRQFEELKAEHGREIAELRGRLQVLESTWAQSLANSLATAVVDAIQQANREVQ